MSGSERKKERETDLERVRETERWRESVSDGVRERGV